MGASQVVTISLMLSLHPMLQLKVHKAGSQKWKITGWKSRQLHVGTPPQQIKSLIF